MGSEVAGRPYINGQVLAQGDGGLVPPEKQRVGPHELVRVSWGDLPDRPSDGLAGAHANAGSDESAYGRSTSKAPLGGRQWAGNRPSDCLATLGFPQ